MVSCKGEPEVDLCVVIDEKRVHCFPSEKEKEEYEKEMKIGDWYVSKEHFSDLKKHHKKLHTEIDSCLSM